MCLTKFFDLLSFKREQVGTLFTQCEIPVTIKEIAFGSTKTVTIERKVFTSKTKFYVEHARIDVPISAGMKNGECIIIPEAGNRPYKQKPLDLAVMLQDGPDEHFKRSGDDLIMQKTVSLQDALCGCVVDVPLPNGKTMKLNIAEVIKPGSTRTVPGEGLPLKNSEKRGDILVEFNVEFPEKIQPNLRDALKKLE